MIPEATSTKTVRNVITGVAFISNQHNTSHSSAMKVNLMLCAFVIFLFCCVFNFLIARADVVAYFIPMPLLCVS